MNNLLAYNDAGYGNETIVLLHGFCEDKHLWSGFEEKLAKDFRVICPDLPGFGESPLLEEDISIEYLADQVYDLITSIGVTNFVLVGHSLGGYVTLAFAKKYPEMLKGIGLFHSTAYTDSDEKKENRNKTIEFLKDKGIAKFASFFVAPLFEQKARNLYTEDIARLTATTAACNVDAVIETTKAMRDRSDSVAFLKETTLPVLYIIGKEDTAVPLSHSLEQIQLPKHCVAHLISNCGHMGMIEKREETYLALWSFCKMCF